MASRKIDDLAIEMQKPCLDFIHLAKQDGIDVLVYCTYRPVDEQDALYEQGRTRPGLIVTHARAGVSPHNCTFKGRPASLAFDAVPVVHGRPIWSTTDEDLQRWAKLGTLAAQVGLVWGGLWEGRKIDRPHFEILNWKEINNAKNP